ncbi:hypothetical protein ACVBE9_00745 [Eionea flava]
MQATVSKTSGYLSPRGDVDFQPLFKARREYIHVGSSPVSMRVMALPNGWNSTIEKLVRQQ